MQPLLLCPRGSCVMPSNARPGARGALGSFFVCYDADAGVSQGATAWLPETGPAALAAYLRAGFTPAACGASQDACSVCSWLVPDAVPTPALARACAACR
jgi:hypothetical protein